jgi:chlorite dismutase
LRQSVDQVKTRLESERADLPVGKHGRDDKDLILWFLRDRKFDVDATIAKLIKALVIITIYSPHFVSVTLTSKQAYDRLVT